MIKPRRRLRPETPLQPTEKLAVCLVSTEYPPDTGWGGIGTYTYELAHGLQAVGVRVVVLSRALERYQHALIDGIDIYRIPAPRVLEGRGGWRIKRLWDGYNAAVASWLGPICRAHSIDVIEAPEVRAETFWLGLSPWRRLPLVVKLHTGTAQILQVNDRTAARRDRLMIWMEQRAVRQADLVVSPSQALIDHYRSDGSYLGAKQPVCVLPNPIDTRRFKMNGRLNPLGSPYVLYVGRVEKLKGVPALFRAMDLVWQRHPETRLVLIGSRSRLLDELLAKVPERQRSRIIHLGHMLRSEIAPFYQHAAAVVLPSLWENLSYSCMESLASGAPTVACATGGSGELIADGETGFLVPPHDHRRLAERIIDLLTNPRLGESVGNNAARRIAERFDTSVVIPETIRHYRQVIADFATGKTG